MSNDLALRRKIEKALTEYLKSMGAFIDYGRVEVSRGVFVELDHLAEAIADEIERK